MVKPAASAADHTTAHHVQQMTDDREVHNLRATSRSPTVAAPPPNGFVASFGRKDYSDKRDETTVKKH